MPMHRLSTGIGALCLSALVLSTVGCLGRNAPPETLPSAASASAPACSFCTRTTPPPTCSLCLQRNPLLVAEPDGTASGLLQLCNHSAEALLPVLRVSDFSAAPPGHEPYMLGTVSLSAADMAQQPIIRGAQALAPLACVAVKIEATGLTQPGVMTARLSDGDHALAQLKAVRKSFDFRLVAEGPTPEKIALTVQRGDDLKITLRNLDPVPYLFSWRLELDGQIQNGRMLALPGQPLQLQAPLNKQRIGFWDSGFLRAGQQQGRLFLRHEPDPSFEVRATETRDYPVSARLLYWSPTWQSIANALAVLVVLLIGIFLSLLINFALPMQRRCVAVKQRLADLDGRLGGIGSVISSRTLNLLRVEKRRLREEVRILWPIFPSTEVALPMLEHRVEALSRRVDLTVDTGELLKAVVGDTGLARHEIDDATRLCRLVLRMVEKPLPSADEFTRAQAALDGSAAIRAQREDKPGSQALAALESRADKARKDVVLGAEPPWPDLQELLTGLRAEFLDKGLTDCERQRYVDAANAVAKAEVIQAYANLVQTAGSKPVRDGRLAFAKPLLDALRPGPGESATEARRLLLQAEENVSVEQIDHALRNPQTAGLWIEVDPPTPRQYQLVTLRVHLGAPGLDNASARSRFHWRWQVNGQDVPAGQDWTGWHYFEQPRTTDWLRPWSTHPAAAAPDVAEFEVSAQALDPAAPAMPIVTLTASPVRLETSRTHLESSTALALVSLFVTVLLVGLGLLASAQEKLQTLDATSGFMAIILIGFGADVLKRALSRS